MTDEFIIPGMCLKQSDVEFTVYCKKMSEKDAHDKAEALSDAEMEYIAEVFEEEMYGYRIFERKRCPHCNEILDDYDKDELEASYGYIGLECVREAVNREMEHGN